MVPESITLAIGLAPVQLDSIPFGQIGVEPGGGAVIGGVIGFAAKKIAKLIAVIIGLELALFKFLETRGVLQVNWKKITNASANVTDTAKEGGEAGAGWLDSFLSTLPVGAGFVGGFFLGFKKG
jgi:uncharacterized membrane protein (Fun14 family)